MSTIRHTCSTVANDYGLGQFITQAEPIIAALERREQQVVASLRQQGLRQGLSTDLIDTALASAGLEVSRPTSDYQGRHVSTPADQRGGQQGMQDTINDLVREVEALKRAAERAGLSV